MINKFLFFAKIIGRLSSKLYENLRRQAAAVKIQKNARRLHSRKSYKNLHVAALVVQTGLRAMAAHKQFRFRKQTKNATTIQVCIFVVILHWSACLNCRVSFVLAVFY